MANRGRCCRGADRPHTDSQAAIRRIRGECPCRGVRPVVGVYGRVSPEGSSACGHVDCGIEQLGGLLSVYRAYSPDKCMEAPPSMRKVVPLRCDSGVLSRERHNLRS
jgi:hypothetical protein